MALKTDYQDQILNTSVNTQRKYEMTINEDNTISLTDVSVYSQEGDDFTAAIVNTTNEMVNTLSVDYVVEQGTDANGWTYRKWNSGRYEAWKSVAVTWQARTQISGVWRAISDDISGPTTPMATSEVQLASGANSGSWVGYVAPGNNNTYSYYLYSMANNAAYPTTVKTMIIGTWK